MRFTLGPAARAGGYRVLAYDSIGSTNAEAMSICRAGDSGGLWVVSAHQTAGRGRRGGHWETPPGNLAASLLQVVDNAPAVAATLGFVAGLALDDALRRIVPALSVRIVVDGIEPARATRGDRLRLKWPNDVLLDGGKLAGILLEAEPLPDGRLAVVVGIGVNVTSAPDDLPYPTSSIASLATGIDASDVFSALSDAWAGWERLWAEGAGFARIRTLWLDRAAGLGEDVAVRVGDDVCSGVFDTIDDAGRLVVRTNDGTLRTISAGEVHFGAFATVRT